MSGAATAPAMPPPARLRIELGSKHATLAVPPGHASAARVMRWCSARSPPLVKVPKPRTADVTTSEAAIIATATAAPLARLARTGMASTQPLAGGDGQGNFLVCRTSFLVEGSRGPCPDNRTHAAIR